MADIQQDSQSQPDAPSRLIDHRTTPAGVMPRRLQQWVILGIAVVMMAILALAGPTQPSKPSGATATTTAPLAIDPNQQRIEEYQRRVQEQAQRLAAEQAQLDLTKQAMNLGAADANGALGRLPPGIAPDNAQYPGTQPAPSTSPSSTSGVARDSNAAQHVSDNVAFSRALRSSGSVAGDGGGSPVAAANAASMKTAATLLAALTANQQNPFARGAGQSDAPAALNSTASAAPPGAAPALPGLPVEAADHRTATPVDTASTSRDASPSFGATSTSLFAQTPTAAGESSSSNVAASPGAAAPFSGSTGTQRFRSSADASTPTVSVSTRPGVAGSTARRLRLPEGTLIETALTNRLDGTFRGPVNVLVTVPVFAGRVLLVPAGSRLLGESNPVTALGQRRLAVVFHRLLYPTGESIDLDAFPGLDQAGDLGLTDLVDGHYGRIFGTSIALGLLGGLTQAHTSAGFDVPAEDRYRQGVASSVGQSGTRILDRFLNILPTITIREGHRIKVYLTRDLDLPAYSQQPSVAGGVRP